MSESHEVRQEEGVNLQYIDPIVHLGDFVKWKRLVCDEPSVMVEVVPRARARTRWNDGLIWTLWHTQCGEDPECEDDGRYGEERWTLGSEWRVSDRRDV